MQPLTTPPPTPTAEPPSGPRRNGLLALGIVLLVAGLVAAIALWVAADSRYDDAVTGLARAPVGCDTTLDFSETGEFLIFVETAGSVDNVRGDCAVEGDYDVGSGDPPDVVLAMIDPDGGDVDLDLRSGVEYDTAGFVGESIRSVDISTTGDHLLRVESTSGETFAVAVGKDPNDGVALLRGGAVIAFLVGVVAGVVLIVIGARRKTPAVDQGPSPWPAGGAWPQTPPGAPTQPGWPGGQPPTGPPQGWAGQQQPTGGWAAPAPAQPPAGQAPGYPTQPQPATSPPGYPAPPQQRPPASTPGPQVPGEPNLPGAPADGSTGDGERSPWAPPGDD